VIEPKAISLGIFATAYVLFVLLPHKRTIVAVCSVILTVLLGAVSGKEAFLAINWNVMGIFVGIQVVAGIVIESRVPAYLAEIIADKAKNTAWAILSLCALTAAISTFLDNVATVLIVAPIALSIAHKLHIHPAKMMIGIAISSNLQGAATLVGDPPSMLLGGFAKMNFMDFFFYHGKPSIFFAVELGAIASLAVLYFVFREHDRKVPFVSVEKIQSWTPTGILTALIALLIISSFAEPGFSYMAGILCAASGVCSILWWRLTKKGSVVSRVKSVDWNTAFFLMSVFILVGSITITGWIDVISDSLSKLVGQNIFFGYTMLVFIAVLVSAFVDNIPFLAAMLPVAISMSQRLGIAPSLFLFGLLIGASLGGNITPIGASANIITCGMLKKEGHVVRFGEFAKIGLPFTLAAVTTAYLFVWFVWKP
jgi:Na+/H+ antiporter NhaD/arsenite permease-like protein